MAQSFEELLAGFEGEEETPPETETSEPKQSNAVIKQIRDHGKRLEKELAAKTKELAERDARLAELEARSNAEALGAAGFTPAQQTVFLKAYDNTVTPETIAQFRTEVLGQGEPPAAPQGFGPAEVTGEQQGRVLSKKDVADILRVNPGRWAEMEELDRQGRVQWSS